jgi:malonyl CoA-acyl carrier protein transacylase/NAD(P)-dependent dehydrogenase (short-subunit alcohol dehydrogenase family)/acyl carrier protein
VREIVQADPAGERHRLRDLAATVSRAGAGPIQVAIVATDLVDLAEKLAAAGARAISPAGVFLASPEAASNGGARPPIAFMYPGQGSQRTGMLADLFVTFPELRELLVAGAEWSQALYPGAAFSPEERKEQSAIITDTRVAQPVLGICGLAMTQLLASVGVTPDMTAGHSYGELVALAAAGTLEPGGLLELSKARGHAIIDAAMASGADPGTMAAVNAPLETVAAALLPHPDVVIANHNGPTQVVISGPSAAVAAAVAEFTASGVSASTINVACAFHSPLVASASKRFAADLASVSVQPPRIPVWANTTADRYPASPEEIRELLAEQIARPVRFVEQVQAMYDAGVRIFVEAGPGRVLTQLVDKILGDRPHRAIATDAPREQGVERFLLALAELAVAGVDVQTDALFVGRAVELDLRELPVGAPAWTINGHLVRTASGDVVEGSLQPSDEFPTIAAGGVVASPDREATVLEYLRGLREIVAAERDVMLRYLGTADADIASPSNGAAPPRSLEPPAESPQAAPQPVRGDLLVAAVIGVVADRTGYPADMLDLDLDLEADLSIDSIKRIEIIGELSERIGLAAHADGGVDDAALEALAQLRTLREIVTWIEALDLEPVASDPAPTPSTNGDHPLDPQKATEQAGTEVPSLAARHTVAVVAVDPPAADPRRLEGTSILIADDTRGVARTVAANLEEWGAAVSVIAADRPPSEADLELLRSADSLIWLRALHPLASPDPASFDARAAFAWWQPALLGRATRLIAATSGGSFTGKSSPVAPGLGLAGMAKAISRELTDRTLRIVDFDPNGDATQLAAHVVDEFFDTDTTWLEVGYHGTQRVTRIVLPERLPSAPTGSAGPLRLDADAVVLMTGGARGITAHAALAIAGRGAGRLELVGRSLLPADSEDPATAAAIDAPALRRALIDTGSYPTPAAVEAQCSRILAAREIRRTLAALGELGCDVRYHQLDVRDASALAGLVKDVYRRCGRLDLVVHGAGIIEDHSVRDKTAESFERVFATKVDAARTLLEATAPDTAVVLFGSVSGVFGNRGQVDYAAANDGLDELADTANRSRPGRVVTIDWGPWAGTGMVSPELEREYGRRGVGLIAPEDGTRALLDELESSTGPGHVVVMRARPEALAPEMGELGRPAEALRR